jgi:hypothetical protein
MTEGVLGIITISRIIFQLNAPAEIKSEISHCTFYGVQVGSVNISKRFRECKHRFYDQAILAKEKNNGRKSKKVN